MLFQLSITSNCSPLFCLLELTFVNDEVSIVSFDIQFAYFILHYKFIMHGGTYS